MALPQKNSRTIIVGERMFRWHLFIDDDQPWIKSVVVLADGNRNGAQLCAAYEVESVTPAIVRRIIEFGLEEGWSPGSDKSESRSLSVEQAAECFEYFERELNHTDGAYLWKLDPKGGLHFKIWSASTSNGQLLATMCDIQPRDATEDVVASMIDAALELGWEPEKIRDCFWLGSDACAQALASTKSGQNKTSISTPDPFRVESDMTIQPSTQKSESTLGQV